MKKMYLLLFSILLYAANPVLGGGKLTNKDLAGTWKISDVKISNSINGNNNATVENCYFCDLYRAKLGLTFTEDGKVDYSNYGNEGAVKYELHDTLISFYTQSTANERGERVEFVINVNAKTLTLSKVSPSITETYTFTK